MSTPTVRTARTVGQAGVALVALELWLAFGWAGADAWTQRQVAAVTAVAVVASSALHNLANRLAARRRTRHSP